MDVLSFFTVELFFTERRLVTRKRLVIIALCAGIMEIKSSARRAVGREKDLYLEQIGMALQ